VHISELAAHHVENPREVVNQGDELSVRIIEIDADRRRLSLSLKRVADTEMVHRRAPTGEGDGDDEGWPDAAEYEPEALGVDEPEALGVEEEPYAQPAEEQEAYAQPAEEQAYAQPAEEQPADVQPAEQQPADEQDVPDDVESEPEE
jgi:small subunit ribosomal protein S1